MTKLELDQAFKTKVAHLALEKGRSVKNIARSTFRTEGYVQMVVDRIRAEARGAVEEVV